MLTDALQQLVREAGGDALLLDARNSRGIITDTDKVADICRRLANAGFSRLVDYCAKHEGSGDYTLYLTLRHPAEAHAALTLKWKFTAPDELNTTHENVGAGQSPRPDKTVAATSVAESGGPATKVAATDETDATDETGAREHSPAANGSPPAPTYNANGGAGQPGGTPRRAGFAAHPSLSRVWRAAALCEREIFELVGIPFSGNEALSPLFLEDSFAGHPLRTDFELTPAPDYAAELLKDRREAALLDAPVPDVPGSLDSSSSPGGFEPPPGGEETP